MSSGFLKAAAGFVGGAADQMLKTDEELRREAAVSRRDKALHLQAMAMQKVRQGGEDSRSQARIKSAEGIADANRGSREDIAEKGIAATAGGKKSGFFENGRELTVAEVEARPNGTAGLQTVDQEKEKQRGFLTEADKLDHTQALELANARKGPGAVEEEQAMYDHIKDVSGKPAADTWRKDNLSGKKVTSVEESNKMFTDYVAKRLAAHEKAVTAMTADPLTPDQKKQIEDEAQAAFPKATVQRNKKINKVLPDIKKLYKLSQEEEARAKDFIIGASEAGLVLMNDPKRPGKLVYVSVSKDPNGKPKVGAERFDIFGDQIQQAEETPTQKAIRLNAPGTTTITQSP